MTEKKREQPATADKSPTARARKLPEWSNRAADRIAEFYEEYATVRTNKRLRHERIATVILEEYKERKQ